MTDFLRASLLPQLQSQELGIYSGLPTWVVETRVLEHYLLSSGMCMNSRWLASEAEPLQEPSGLVTQAFYTTGPNARLQMMRFWNTLVMDCLGCENETGKFSVFISDL